MNFSTATSTCLRKYFTLSGRASRSEFWWFALFQVIVTVSAVFLDFAIFGARYLDGSGPFEIIVSLLLLAPAFTVTIRRLHDTGKSAWYILAIPIGMIAGIAFGAIFGPILGTIGSIGAGLIMVASVLITLWWMIEKSAPNANKYGPNPIEVTP